MSFEQQQILTLARQEYLLAARSFINHLHGDSVDWAANPSNSILHHVEQRWLIFDPIDQGGRIIRDNHEVEQVALAPDDKIDKPNSGKQKEDPLKSLRQAFESDGVDDYIAGQYKVDPEEKDHEKKQAASFDKLQSLIDNLCQKHNEEVIHYLVGQLDSNKHVARITATKLLSTFGLNASQRNHLEVYERQLKHENVLEEEHNQLSSKIEQAQPGFLRVASEPFDPGDVDRRDQLNKELEESRSKRLDADRKNVAELEKMHLSMHQQKPKVDHELKVVHEFYLARNRTTDIANFDMCSHIIRGNIIKRLDELKKRIDKTKYVPPIYSHEPIPDPYGD